jgi:regulator of sigma E protease
LIETIASRAFWIAEVVIGLGLLIFIHELGHFLMAKKNKVRVEVFSLGFGHALFKWRRGETEYRISWIPLGGYVKMAGETVMDERRGEPWELTSKSAWQRFEIFTAGAIMNLVIAFPIAVLTFMIGRYEWSNEIGTPGTAETLAGMKPGDVVVEVDGRKIESLEKFKLEMVRRSNGTEVPVKVLRGDAEVTLRVRTMSSPFHQSLSTSLFLERVELGSPLEKAGVRAEDEITHVDGRRVYVRSQLEEALRGSPGRRVTIRVRRRDSSWTPHEFEVTLALPEKVVYWIPDDAAAMECVVAGVFPGQPAWERIEPGDVVTQIDGKEVRSWQDLKEAVEPAVEKDPPAVLRIKVRRDGKPVDVEVIPTYNVRTGRGAIGIENRATSVFANVRLGSAFERWGLRSGDVLKELDGRTGEVTVGQHLLGLRSPTPRDIRIEVRRDGQKVSITAPLEKRTEGDLAALGFPTTPLGGLETEVSRPFRRRAFGEALAAALYEPFDIVVMTFQVLGKLIFGEESMKGLQGPVGIFQAAYRHAELSPGNFFWLLCLITVNLGIFNLLPIPILDGGHVLLLIIEKLRGRPPSERFVAAFQYVGLVFILALVLFVTYNDITR